jgi:hypothetical protein
MMDIVQKNNFTYFYAPLIRNLQNSVLQVDEVFSKIFYDGPFSYLSFKTHTEVFYNEILEDVHVLCNEVWHMGVCVI